MKFVKEVISRIGQFNILWMLSVLVLLLLGFLICYVDVPLLHLSYVPVVRLVIFILASLITGFFYGRNNYWIFHASKNKTDRSPLNKPAEANQFWIHIVCGVIGAIALYLLSFRLDFINLQNTFSQLRLLDLFLFLIAVLGYTGLLPRTLWFFASSPGFPGSGKGR